VKRFLIYLVTTISIILPTTGTWADDAEDPFGELDENAVVAWEYFEENSFNAVLPEQWLSSLEPMEAELEADIEISGGLRHSSVPLNMPTKAVETRSVSYGVYRNDFADQHDPDEDHWDWHWVRSGYRYGRLRAGFDPHYAFSCAQADEIVSAYLRVYIEANHLSSTQSFRIHAIAERWSNYGITWYDQPAYHSDVYNSTSVGINDTGWFSFNATNAVKLYCEQGDTDHGYYLLHTSTSPNINYIQITAYEANDEYASFLDMTYILRCDIGGQKYDHEDLNPANPCLICDVNRDLNNWTLNDGGACNDGIFCNGADTCQVGSCSVHTGEPCPDDGLWCNGAESCDEASQECQATVAPCDPVCQDCDDGADACIDNDDPCNDGLYCTGVDTCGGGSCSLHAGDPCLDDGLFCTGEEFCDEDANQCSVNNVPDCANDGLWCNGDEFCDETIDACNIEDVPDCSEDGLWCNGEEFCNENDNACDRENIPDCPDDGLWCNGGEFCDEDADECGHDFGPDNPRCNDGIFCNGEDPCDEDTDLCGHGDEDPCSDDGLWCNGDESCDETGDECLHSGDPCDDGEECIEDNDECINDVDDDMDDDTTDDDTADDDTADDDTSDDDTADDDTADDDTTDDDTADDDTADDDTDSDDDSDDDIDNLDDDVALDASDDDSTGSGCGC
jgi:hypothetical protein